MSWDEPHFSDNVKVVKIQESNGHRPGQTLLWGIYQIAYVASDAAGNVATCTFKISVLCRSIEIILHKYLILSITAEFCPELPDPIGGSQTCKDWGAGGQFKVCEIACNPGLRFSQDVPKFYTCGAEGFWRPTQNPSLPMIYPACSGTSSAFNRFIMKIN